MKYFYDLSAGFGIVGWKRKLFVHPVTVIRALQHILQNNSITIVGGEQFRIHFLFFILTSEDISLNG